MRADGRAVPAIAFIFAPSSPRAIGLATYGSSGVADAHDGSARQHSPRPNTPDDHIRVGSVVACGAAHAACGSAAASLRRAR